MSTSTALSTRFTELDNTIRNGVKAYVDMGVAFAEMRESGVYKQGGYETFQDYCNTIHGMTKAQISEKIKCGLVAKALTDQGLPAPESESHAKALASVVDFKTKKSKDKKGGNLGNADNVIVGVTAPAAKRAAKVWTEVIENHNEAVEEYNEAEEKPRRRPTITIKSIKAVIPDKFKTEDQTIVRSSSKAHTLVGKMRAFVDYAAVNNLDDSETVKKLIADGKWTGDPVAMLQMISLVESTCEGLRLMIDQLDGALADRFAVENDDNPREDDEDWDEDDPTPEEIEAAKEAILAERFEQRFDQNGMPVGDDDVDPLTGDEW